LLIGWLVGWAGLTPGFKDATRIKKHDWTNEDQERGLLGQGLRGLDDDDIILLTDADEIANADALNFYRHFTGTPTPFLLGVPS
jgi:hypothetical protein